MPCCNKIRKKKIVIGPERNIVEFYKEGQDGWATINYLDENVLRIKGCKSGHIYLFGGYGQYKIDSNDADCLFDSKPGLFEEVVEYAIASDISASEIEPDGSAEENYSGYE